MLVWKHARGLAIVGAALALMLAAPGPAAAQQAAAAPAPAKAAAAPAVAAPAQQAAPAKKPVFRARDLMTAQERQSYRAAMRAARENPARQRELRDQLRATLQQRAAARGGVLWTPAMNQPAAQKEARPEARSAAPPPRAP